LIGHINKVKLRRVQLTVGFVTTFGGSTIPARVYPLPDCTYILPPEIFWPRPFYTCGP